MKDLFGLEDEDLEEVLDKSDVDQHMDENGNPEPVVTEVDEADEEKGQDALADNVALSTEDLNEMLGFEDEGDEVKVVVDGDEVASVPIDDDGSDEGSDEDSDDDDGAAAEDTGSDDEAGEEDFSFGFEDELDDPLGGGDQGQAAPEAPAEQAAPEDPAATPDTDTDGGDNDATVDVNLNITVDDGKNGGATADEGQTLSSEDFDNILGFEDDVTVEINTGDTDDTSAVEESEDDDDVEGEAATEEGSEDDDDGAAAEDEGEEDFNFDFF